jgi:hypothetical protein
LVALGCGPDYKTRAVVKGKVTMGGQPLTAGTVTFYGPHNIVSSASIQEDGSYEIKDAPIGDVKVSVKVNAPTAQAGPSKGGIPAWARQASKFEPKDANASGASIPLLSKIPEKVVRIPDKFGDPENSGLTYKVEKGEHVWDIKL